MSKSEILLMDWEDMFYWYRRAAEIFFAITQRPIKPIEEKEDGKVDDDVFNIRLKRLEDRLNAINKSKEGTISG